MIIIAAEQLNKHELRTLEMLLRNYRMKELETLYTALVMPPVMTQMMMAMTCLGAC